MPFGTDAFGSIAEVLTTYSSFSGTIIVNGGTYTSDVDLSGGTIALQFVQDLTDSETTVTIQSLTGEATDSINTSLHAGAVNLSVEDGSFAGAISGLGGLT